MRIIFVLIVSILCTSSFAELSQQAEKDRLMLSLSENLKKKHWHDAASDIHRLENLGLSLPSPFYFFKGETYIKIKKPKTAINALERYIELEGESGRYYTQALSYFNEAEKLASAHDIEKRKKEEAQNLEQLERLRKSGRDLRDTEWKIESEISENSHPIFSAMSELCRHRVDERYWDIAQNNLSGIDDIVFNGIGPENFRRSKQSAAKHRKSAESIIQSGIRKHKKLVQDLKDLYKKANDMDDRWDHDYDFWMYVPLNDGDMKKGSAYKLAKKLTLLYEQQNICAFVDDDRQDAHYRYSKNDLSRNDYIGPRLLADERGVKLYWYYKNHYRKNLPGAHVSTHVVFVAKNTTPTKSAAHLGKTSYTCQDGSSWNSSKSETGYIAPNFVRAGQTVILAVDRYVCAGSKPRANQRGVKAVRTTLETW